jgi:outer membrane protein assembly factor BamB
MTGLRLIGRPMRVAAAVAVVAGLAAGCGLFGEKKAPPAPLPEFQPSVTVATSWRLSLGSGRGTFLQPAVTDNGIYAASAAGTVQRVDPASGSVVWRTEVQSRLVAGVGADGFAVAVTTPRGEVITLDADGRERWRAQVNSDVISPPLVGRGLVIVRSTDQRVSAFEADTGKRRWIYVRQVPPLTLRASTELAFAGDNVLAGFPGGRLVAIALANGAARWESSVSEPRGTTEVERLADVLGPLVVDAGQVCAASFQGRVTCADAGSGTLRWTRDLSAGAGVARDARGVYAVDAGSQLHAFAADNGASLWRNERLANRALTTPLALAGVVAVGDLAGYVHFLTAAEGSFAARVQVDSSAITARPLAWGDGAVVLTSDGTLALLTPRR